MNRDAALIAGIALVLGYFILSRRANASTGEGSYSSTPLFNFGPMPWDIPSAAPLAEPYVPNVPYVPYVPPVPAQPVDPGAAYPDVWSATAPDNTDVALDDIFAPPGLLEGITSIFQPASYPFDPMTNPNMRAFLAMIGYSEGADYNTLFGGGTFADYSDHPRTLVRANGYKSTAAGKYQILVRSWDDYVRRMGYAPRSLPFTPENQDAYAIDAIKRRGATSDVLAGRFASAVQKVRKEWASLPGAGYGQPERALSQLRGVYLAAGGVDSQTVST